MNINKLKESQIKEFKNYKVACEFLEEEIKSGKSKKIQLEDWERYFAFHKEGQKIIIDCIYNDVIPKTDKRLEGNNSTLRDKLRNKFNIPWEDRNRKGVYIIKNKENDIYIGSTIVGFRTSITITMEQCNTHMIYCIMMEFLK